MKNIFTLQQNEEKQREKKILKAENKKNEMKNFLFDR